MKIKSEQLSEQLKKGLQKAYWLASDEVFLQQITGDQIRLQAKKLDFLERQVLHVEGSFDWDKVYALCHNRSLFGNKQLLELHFPNKITENDRKALQRCLTYLHDELCLLILSGKIEAAAQKTKWFEGLTQPLCFIPIWPLDPRHYLSFLKNRCAHYQIQIEHTALQLLSSNTQGHPAAADQILQQLLLIFGQTPITAAQMAEISQADQQTDLFAFVDVFLLHDQPQTLAQLQLLKNQGIEPILIIWALARELRQLNAILLQIQQGRSLHAALQTQHIWPTRQALFTHACKHFSIPGIHALIQQLAMIDLQIKGAESGAVWLNIEQLLIFP